MSTQTPSEQVSPLDQLAEQAKSMMAAERQRGIEQGKLDARREIAGLNQNRQKAADRITLLEALLKKAKVKLPEGAETSPDSEMARAIVSGIALLSMSNRNPDGERLRAAYLRKNGWVLQPNGMWRDPKAGGAFACPMAIESQAKDDLSIFAHLLAV